ncbi:P-loop containing nucleoside triphosphate hydrolase protein [Chaetomidium leptoderma]|uniref:P-loop containing nucleoside triphosphate hydrolase protein n=1 Tax=Chaetomidium leptoderma TaxID=669021 RepID=A0AAN6VL39_9PEZI|nr:P-loop containing nucleoside triphosphate hydrolase protein [Chaetomidium leptoderma]
MESSGTTSQESQESQASQVILHPDPFAQLNTSDARSLLDTIDSLRELGVGDFVNLPQIIVVGDQSSGKSSVLEAISRVRFPVDGDLCTRFATELVLRRANETAVNVNIQFADDAPSTGQGDALRQPFQRSTFDKDALPDIIKEAKELMSIRKGGAKKFSKDILRVEVAGPDIHPLTLVDLPGIFHSATADQDLEDKEIVDHLIESYMRQPKSVILAVVAANNQLANQAVLRQAKKYDPNRERTIGVITKPDMAGRGSANEKKYLDLARGRESMHKLALGWYVLRNRSEEERSSEAEVRDTVEERFFRTGEWSTINPANKGVQSLRKRLSKVLLDHIKTNLPSLIQDIETNLRTRQQELDRFGKSRSSPEELRSYLLGIAEDFQRLARDAIEGRYSNEFFGGYDENESKLAKLRAVLRNMNCAFEVVMETRGARYKIERGDADDGEGLDDESGRVSDYLQQLIDDYDVPEPESKPESELNAELQSLASFNRGRELPGDINPELVFQLFKKQAAPWQDIARKHLDHVLEVAKAFVDRVFIHVIGADDATLRAILNVCVDPFFTAKEDLLQAKLQELLLPYTSNYALPLDEEFRGGMYKKTLQRLALRLAVGLETQHPGLFQFNTGESLSRQKILDAVHEPERSERNKFDIETVIDRMLVYYEVSEPSTQDCPNSRNQMSLRTFIDNVINLAVESCLVYHIPTILTPRKVDGMTVEMLEELASESDEVQRQRSDLEDEVRILREGLGKCQKHKPREVSAATTPQRSPTPAGDPTPAPAANASEHPPASATSSAQAPANQPSKPPPVSTTGPLFGASTKPPPVPSTGTLFGASTKPPPVPPTGSLFGASTKPPPVPSTGSSLFGASTKPTPVPPTGSSLFGGSTKPPSGSANKPLFGSYTPANKDNGKPGFGA